MMTAVESAILEAWNIGQRFDLSDCLYGRPHWAGAPPANPYPYYFFLAGLAHTRECQRVLEIGTHMGGSILSIRKGVGEAIKRIVTIDPTALSDPVLASYPEIQKIQGDASDPIIISQVVELFAGNPIDMLYIDAFHDYEHTIQHYGIFVSLLRPKMVVMDDIFLNTSMRKMWFDIRRASPKETSDTTVVCDQIRNIDAGFGVRIIGGCHTDPAAPTVVSDINASAFRTHSITVDAGSLSNPTEQMISLRARWLESSELFAPIVRVGSAEASRSPDRRLCIFADTASSCVYASTFAQEPGQEMVCITPPGSFPRGRTCQISVKASTALGYLEVELDGRVTKAWWEASGRMCAAEPRILVGANSARVAVDEIQLTRYIV